MSKLSFPYCIVFLFALSSSVSSYASSDTEKKKEHGQLTVEAWSGGELIDLNEKLTSCPRSLELKVSSTNVSGAYKISKTKIALMRAGVVVRSYSGEEDISFYLVENMVKPKDIILIEVEEVLHKSEAGDISKLENYEPKVLLLAFE